MNFQQIYRKSVSCAVKFKDKTEYVSYLLLFFKWDRALAMAPGISMDYWKELMERYIFKMKLFLKFLVLKS